MGVLGREALRVWNLIEDWSDKDLYEGKNIKELFTYDDASLWWFMGYWLVNKVRYVPYNVGDLYVAAKKGTVKRFEKQVKWRVFRAKTHSKLMDMRLFIRKILTSKQSKRHPKAKGDRKRVLVLAKSTGMRPMKDQKTGKTRMGNVYLDPIIQQLKERNFEIVQVERAFGINKNWRQLKGAKGWIALESYEPKGVGDLISKETKRIKELWSKVRPSTKGSLIFNGQDLSDYLAYSLDVLFETRVPQIIRLVETMKNMLEIENPDAVLFVSDTRDTERAIVVAAKQKGIPTFGLAHGVFSEEAWFYIHKKGEISPDLSTDAPYSPTPDFLMVYGPLDKRDLVRWNYPAKAIAVTGQPRYDILANAGEFYDRERTCRKIGIDPKKKFVLFATGTHALPKEEAMISLEESYKAAKELSSKIEMVAKLHPNEGIMTPYEQTAEKIGFSPKIVQKYDMLELTYACDLMIQNHSTAAIEAMMLDKPVISMNYVEEDLLGSVKEGASLQVTKPGELAEKIEAALFDKKTREKLKRGSEKFIYERAFKIDGKASDRIGDLIESKIG